MNIKRISTILCVLVLSLVAIQNTFADKCVGGGTYLAGNGDEYTYAWMVDNKGNRYTAWTVNGKPQIPYPGHVVPGPGPMNKAATNDKITAAPVLNVDIRSVGDKILSVSAEESVEGKIIELSSGKVLKQFNIDGRGNVDVGELYNNKAYGIVLTNKAGVTHRTTFIMSDNGLLLGK
ncbi:MAG: hypothetical protein LBO69_09975 [Ignavibacteria bacterium]|jgi:hypothetical protein|nr:hypothetical protein [Ignavibacteria bacterium]